MAAAPRKTAASKTSLAAKQAEATHNEKTKDEAPKVATFEFKGETYEVPADPLDVPMDIAYAESEMDVIEVIAGPEQWGKFRDTRPTIRDFRKFAELVLEASGQGEDEGN
ncbi:hypothetical protein [Streptomyces althioticus]|uniref:hypothetical protein n=1 Tax=Streptomyces althioticus TaxID=83380 RepID=UPI0033CA89CC